MDEIDGCLSFFGDTLYSSLTRACESRIMTGTFFLFFSKSHVPMALGLQLQFQLQLQFCSCSSTAIDYLSNSNPPISGQPAARRPPRHKLAVNRFSQISIHGFRPTPETDSLP